MGLVRCRLDLQLPLCPHRQRVPWLRLQLLALNQAKKGCVCLI